MVVNMILITIYGKCLIIFNSIFFITFFLFLMFRSSSPALFQTQAQGDVNYLFETQERKRKSK